MMTRRSLALMAPIVALALAAAVPAVAQDEELDPPHPAHIHAGACPEPGDVVHGLSDLVTGTDAEVGSTEAIAVEVSTTVVPLPLADIVAAEHAINVHESGDAMDVYIACGDIGGMMVGMSDLAIGLAEQNGSGHQGAAWLHDNGDGTTRVDVMLWSTGGESEQPGMSPAPMESPASMESPGLGASPAPMGSPMASPATGEPESPAASPDPMLSPAASPAA